MLDFIETHYPEVVTLQTLSATLGRQPAYLGRLFHQEVGASVRNYLTRVRLEHAATLVREGVKIEAIALSVGYRSKKNFYQQFKKCYGMTPVPYRCCSGVLAPERRELAAGSAQLIACAAAAPGSEHGRRETQSGSDSEPVVGKLASMIRASNRAWRLAIGAQELIAEHFARSRVSTLLTNDTGRYIGANHAAIGMTGYSPIELCELSPAELFATGPNVDTRCVWQFLLSMAQRPDRAPNATMRTKAGDSVRMHVVTLRNVLWGRPEMSAMLEEARSEAR